MVIPYVGHVLALFELAYGTLPQIHVVKSVAMRSTASREAYELGFHIGNHLSKVGSEAILAVHEGLAREKRNHVKVYGSRCQGGDDKACLFGLLCGFEGDFHRPPLGMADRDVLLCQRLIVFAYEGYL